MMFLSYLDSALLSALLLTLVATRIKSLSNMQAVVIAVAVLLPAVMIVDLPLYQYLRAFIGELSISTKLIALMVLYQRGSKRTIVAEREWRTLITGVAITGLLFYPLALGVSMFDPYSLGFGAISLVIAVAVLAVYCIWRKFWLLLSMFMLCLLGYYAGLLESDNLWDYLIDPLLWLYALFGSCVTLGKKYLSNQKPVRQ